MPSFESAGSDPERVLRDYTAQFETLLGGWYCKWSEIDRAFDTAGFSWSTFRIGEVAHAAAHEVSTTDHPEGAQHVVRILRACFRNMAF